MNELTQRLLPPCLAAAVLWGMDWRFLPAIPNADDWRQFGLLIPALWLAGVGSGGLLRRGGFLMRCFKYDPAEINDTARRSLFRIAATKVALLWLAVGLLVGCGVHAVHHYFPICTGVLKNEWLAYGLGVGIAAFHASLLACLGVFILLATQKES